MPKFGNHSFSFRSLCHSLCCPPCPNFITNKLAFLPPTPTYDFFFSDTDSQLTLALSPTVKSTGRLRILRQEAFFLYPSKKRQIAALYMKCTEFKKFTILFSHGNSCDIGIIHHACTNLCLITGCDVVTYDYAGYGQSTGEPSEKNINKDIRTVYEYILDMYELSPQKVLLYGQSIGTVPTIDLACKFPCAGVILHSPLASSCRIACPWSPCNCIDTLNSINKVPRVISPVLFIHGTDDEAIPLSNAKALYERCPRAVEPLWIDGAGHGNIEMYEEYVKRVQKFINEEVSPT